MKAREQCGASQLLLEKNPEQVRRHSLQRAEGRVISMRVRVRVRMADAVLVDSGPELPRKEPCALNCSDE